MTASPSRPAHYNRGGGQWKAGDFIRDLGLGFDEGNVVAYTVRHKDKDGAEDIRKAIEYLRHILRRDYGAEVVARCPGTKSEDGGSCGPRVPCDGERHADGSLSGGCGEPCDFVMVRVDGDAPGA